MRYVVICAALGSVVGPLNAQSDAGVEPGRRVWVRTREASGSFDRGVKGIVERTLGDTVVIRPDVGGPLVRVWPADTTRLLLFVGRRPSTARGAVIGLLAGAGVGAIIGFAGGEGCPPRTGAEEPPCIKGGGGAVTGALIGGAGGGAVGALAGSQTSHEVWRPSERFLPAAAVAVSTGRGMAFGLSIRF